MATGKSYALITPAQRPSGFPIAVDAPEGASQTFKAGTPVILTSGLVVAAGTNPATIFGFSERAGQNTTGATARLFRPGVNVPFTGTLSATLAATDRGVAVGITIDPGTSGQWFLDKAASTKQCHVVGWDSKWAIGDVNPEVQFVVDQAGIQF